MKDLDVLYEAMQKRKQKDAFAESLKKNPIQESEYKSMIMDMDLDPTHMGTPVSGLATRPRSPGTPPGRPWARAPALGTRGARGRAPSGRRFHRRRIRTMHAIDAS